MKIDQLIKSYFLATRENIEFFDIFEAIDPGIYDAASGLESVFRSNIVIPPMMVASTNLSNHELINIAGSEVLVFQQLDIDLRMKALNQFLFPNPHNLISELIDGIILTCGNFISSECRSRLLKLRSMHIDKIDHMDPSSPQQAIWHFLGLGQTIFSYAHELCHYSINKDSAVKNKFHEFVKSVSNEDGSVLSDHFLEEVFCDASAIFALSVRLKIYYPKADFLHAFRIAMIYLASSNVFGFINNRISAKGIIFAEEDLQAAYFESTYMQRTNVLASGIIGISDLFEFDIPENIEAGVAREFNFVFDHIKFLYSISMQIIIASHGKTR